MQAEQPDVRGTPGLASHAFGGLSSPRGAMKGWGRSEVAVQVPVHFPTEFPQPARLGLLLDPGRAQHSGQAQAGQAILVDCLS